MHGIFKMYLKKNNTFFNWIFINKLTNFREESESIVHLKGLTPSGTLPLGTLQEGKKGIEDGLLFFDCRILDCPERDANASLSKSLILV
jgi:hypothetical protein